jgi:nitrate/TMAO reductase-like tetraheme cytochrome c subunit
MSDEHEREMSAPPRFRYKGFKFMTLTLFILVLFVILGFSGLKTTSSSQFCSSCHEMKPEYYTWKASTHSEVACVSCHKYPGVEQIAKIQAGGIAKNIRHEQVTAAAIIRTTKEIPNSACEKCHNMSTRQVTPSGDLIIPHDKHLEKNIKCTQCHSNVAHGDIADRNMTFQTDYDKWDSKMGTTAMADLKFTRPTMDSCMNCHIARKISIECKTCHSTGMEPESHKKADFKTKTHGLLAKTELKECDSCHKYMSTTPLEGYGTVSTVDKYLNQDSGKQNKNENTYAKENTFCQACHSLRPASHTSSFFSTHGTAASKDQEKCYTCHDTNKTTTSGSNAVNCSSCHQVKHPTNWREHHPIPVNNVKRPEERCYTCHDKQTCTNCHKN